MIAQLTGKLIHKSPQQVIVDVVGVGYCVTVSLNTFTTLAEIGNTTTLSIYTYVREDQLTLFGFASPEEKHLFQRLIGVSGVGPKLAMALLSGIPPSQLIASITSGDVVRLNAIPGVGKKTAERIVVDLKDKLARDPISSQMASAPRPINSTYDDAVSALTNLGYTKIAAEKALSKNDWTKEVALESAIRSALKELSGS